MTQGELNSTQKEKKIVSCQIVLQTLTANCELLYAFTLEYFILSVIIQESSLHTKISVNSNITCNPYFFERVQCNLTQRK